MRAAIHSAIGPAVMAAALWCALGDLTVATPVGATTRLAVPASWWWLPGAFAAAWCVSPWRRFPSLAAPALLTTLPWWPVPLPAIALLWTGGLAWVPIGLALMTAVAERKQPEDAPAGRTLASPYRSAALAGLASLFSAMAVAWSLAPQLPNGDEPHYLIIKI